MYNLCLLRQLEQRLETLLAHSRLWSSNDSIQHGDTTVLLHCIAVAYFSLKLVRFLGLKCDKDSLIRGALLHDYFLYDWHISGSCHRFHGFYHPSTALKNAQEDFALTEREQDIISHHMFPLTPSPPRCREALLVCVVDKGCALYETFARNTYPSLREIICRQERLSIVRQKCS